MPGLSWERLVIDTKRPAHAKLKHRLELASYLNALRSYGRIFCGEVLGSGLCFKDYSFKKNHSRMCVENQWKGGRKRCQKTRLKVIAG